MGCRIFFLNQIGVEKEVNLSSPAEFLVQQEEMHIPQRDGQILVAAKWRMGMVSESSKREGSEK